MKLTSFVLVFATIMALGLYAGMAHALNQPTHRLVNRAAADTEEFGSLLQSQFGLLRGLGEPFKNRRVIDWIGEGGDTEDAAIRFLRHFHDPLRPWDGAGSRCTTPRSAGCSETMEFKAGPGSTRGVPFIPR